VHQSLYSVFGKDHPLFQAIDEGLVVSKPGDTWPRRLARLQDALALWDAVHESIHRRVGIEPDIVYDHMLRDDGYDD
jgi:hypothetical protein